MTSTRFARRTIAALTAVVIAFVMGAAVLVRAVDRPGHPARVQARLGPTSPNVLIIVLDTLRYDATSMGGGGNTSFLQTVADRGISFSRAYSTHDSTPESHFSLFTGQRDGYGTFPDRADMSLSYQLRARGYDTFGIAANGNLSNRWGNMLSGFTRYVCLYEEWEGIAPAQRSAVVPSIDARLDAYGSSKNDWNESQLYASADRVIDRLHSWLPATHEPFLGFVNLIDAHDPYLPSHESLGAQTKAGARVPADIRYRKLGFPLADPEEVADRDRREWLLRRLANASNRAWALPDDLKPIELETYKARYAASVKDLDGAVRRIFAELDERHLLERTWVVVVGDHGESFGEWGYLTHSLGDKGDPEATRHVPMVWAPPALRRHGVISDENVSLMDVAPTIYDLVGVDWKSIRARAIGEFGRSLMETVSAQKTTMAAVPATTASSRFAGPPPEVQDQIRERLRALGYLR